MSRLLTPREAWKIARGKEEYCEYMDKTYGYLSVAIWIVILLSPLFISVNLYGVIEDREWWKMFFVLLWVVIPAWNLHNLTRAASLVDNEDCPCKVHWEQKFPGTKHWTEWG